MHGSFDSNEFDLNVPEHIQYLAFVSMARNNHKS